MSDNQKIEDIEETSPETGSSLDHKEDQDVADDFLDDDWESYDDDAADQAGPVGAGKKKSQFNKILIGGAVVVGLGVFYMQMHNAQKSAAPAAPQQTAAAVAPQQAAPQAAPQQTAGNQFPYAPNKQLAPAPAPKAAESPTGMLNNPTALNEVQKTAEQKLQETGAQAMKQAQQTDQSGSDAENGLNPGAQKMLGSMPHEVTQQPPMPAPIGQADTGNPQEAPPPSSPGLPKASDVTLTPQVQTQAPTQAQAAPAPGGSPDISGVKTLESKLDGISGKLGSIETRLTALEDNAVGKSELSALSTQVSSLKTQVDGLTSAAAPVQEKLKPEKAERQASPRKPRTSHLRKSPISPGKSVLTNWVLRSAQSGKALVSRQGQDDILSVKTGDMLEGIGRITAIHEENGLWVVRGARGVIRQ